MQVNVRRLTCVRIKREQAVCACFVFKFIRARKNSEIWSKHPCCRHPFKGAYSFERNQPLNN